MRSRSQDDPVEFQRRSLQALIWIWSELPALLGRRWADLYPPVHQGLHRLITGGESEENRGLALEILELLSTEPKVAAKLREARYLLGARPAHRSGEPLLTPKSPPWRALQSGLQECVAPAAVRRHAEVQAPRSLAAGERGVVEIRLRRLHASSAGLHFWLDLYPRRQLEVHCHADPDVLEVEEPSVVRRLLDPEEVDGEEAEKAISFRIQGVAPGLTRLYLDFRQGGQLLRQLVLLVRVGSVGAETPHQESVDFVATDPGVPPDAELRVIWDPMSRRPRYILHAPNFDLHLERLEGRTLERDEVLQTGFLGELTEDVKSLFESPGNLTPSERLQSLENSGKAWGRVLFTDPWKKVLEDLFPRIQSLRITTDEPWFPWELVHTSGSKNDDFLSTRFQLTRWLPGRPPPTWLQIRRQAVVRAGWRDNLPAAEEDVAFLAKLAEGADIRQVQPSTLEELRRHLDEGEIQLWHFANHGMIPLDGRQVSLALPDGNAFKLNELNPDTWARIGQDRPMVFLNACNSGQNLHALEELDGWAPRWVRGGCGALVAPLWSVNDRLASLFARELYDRLREGQYFGEAVQQLKASLREHPERAEWLSYTVYAHPYARVFWGP